MVEPSVEQLILARGRRGIERLAPYLPVDYAAQAARALWKCRRVLITTGFHVEGHPETDGPPGALFLGRAMAALEASVSFVGEPNVLELLKAMAQELWQCQPVPGGSNTHLLGLPGFIEFPIASAEASKSLAAEILSDKRANGVPGKGAYDALVAIERCGRTQSGHYRNMRGIDISQWTARVDELFLSPGDHEVVTVGIGDGGNEVGMGLMAEHLVADLGITDPVATHVDHLVLAAVSNWGAYGIIAYLSALARRDLLPKEGEEARALRILANHGAIDGLTHQAGLSVDGFPPEVTADLIAALHRELQPGERHS